MVLKINNKTELEIETQLTIEGFKYEDFEAAFPSDQGRCVLWLILIKIIRSLDTNNIETNLENEIYHFSDYHIDDGIGSIVLQIQADDISDVTYDKLKQKLLEKFK